MPSDLLVVLKCNDSDLVKNEGVVWCNSFCLNKESFCKLSIVRQSVLETDVE